VREALDAYLESLGDHDAQELFRLVMREVEVPMLEAVLAHSRGNQSKAAQMLGINRGTLRKKLRLYGLE
jgi:Fis family transcriptional regulator